MLKFPCQVPTFFLQGAVYDTPLEDVKDGSGRARGTDTKDGWIHGLAMARIDPWECSEIAYVIRSLILSDEQVIQVMINRLDPGGKLSLHRDGPPFRSRWHLPIMTNPDAIYWDEINGEVRMEEGFWYGPTPYWVRHSVHNNGKAPRYHLIVDVNDIWI